MKLFQHNKLPFAILLLLFALLLLLNNNGLSLWDQDEAAYAGFAWQMNHTGNYLIPDFPWSEPHRKTPLHFWLIAASYKLFGVSEFATRIPSVLAILGTIAIVWAMGRRLLGEAAAKLAALALMANLLLIVLAKIAFTDAALLFFETLALLSLLSWVKTSKYQYAALWVVALAGGMLTKGPPIVIVALGTCGIVFIFSKKRLTAFIAALLVLPAFIPLYIWGYATFLHDGGKFVEWLVDWYILKRTSGSVFGQTGPPGYHLAVMLLAFIAVLPWLPGSFGQHVKSTLQRNAEALVLTGWLVCGWLFYEALPSKLPTYALAVYPAVALILGQYAETLGNTLTVRILSVFKTIALGLLGVLVVGIAFYMNDILSTVLAALLLLPVLFLVWLSIKNKSSEVGEKFTYGFLLTAIVVCSVWLFAIPQAESKRGAAKSAIIYMKNHAGATHTVAMSKHFLMPSWPTYCAWNGLQFNDAFNEDEWLQMYNNHTADYLVFDQENIGRFKELMGSTPINDTVIKGFISDRMVAVDYHLVRITP